MNFISHDLLTINKNLAGSRLSYTYKAELSKTVPNPFYNYGTRRRSPARRSRSRPCRWLRSSGPTAIW